MSLLPSRVEAAVTPEEPRVLDVDGEAADAAFDALSSETARRILKALYEEPRTPTEVREEVGTSLQNVHYHLGNLESADLIEPAGFGYSEKGNEMTVYAPATEALVLFAGGEGTRGRLKRVLQRVFGLFVVLSVASLGLHYLLEWLAPAPESGEVTLQADSVDAGGGDGGGGGGVGSPGTEPLDLVPELAGLDPALAFFLGGLVVIAALGAWWYYRGY